MMSYYYIIPLLQVKMLPNDLRMLIRLCQQKRCPFGNSIKSNLGGIRTWRQHRSI